jgi:hypothetical protein
MTTTVRPAPLPGRCGGLSRGRRDRSGFPAGRAYEAAGAERNELMNIWLFNGLRTEEKSVEPRNALTGGPACKVQRFNEVYSASAFGGSSGSGRFAVRSVNPNAEATSFLGIP